jgi:hypothetical protein
MASGNISGLQAEWLHLFDISCRRSLGADTACRVCGGNGGEGGLAEKGSYGAAVCVGDIPPTGRDSPFLARLNIYKPAGGQFWHLTGPLEGGTDALVGPF